ncbi:MAG: pyridoxamine 5'-phosphate oxidase family protein [Pseudomonadota bacterium]
MNSLNQAINILSENIYCSVATASKEGVPWNTPVFYSYDQHLNLYWASAIDAVHSRFLRENPLAFIVVFNSSAPARCATAVYLQGHVHIVSDDILDNKVIQHFKRVNEDSLFTGDYYRGSSPERLYAFTPEKVWVLGEPVDQGGHPVDARTELSLDALRKYLNAS